MPERFLKHIVYTIPVYVWIILAVCCIIGYWPLSTGLFSLKNDAYMYFLPCRYMVSDAIQNGQAPWWNPYFYMGYPLHGDMQSGVWNPVVIFSSLFTRYNMTMLHIETLLYIFIGGIGMYKLTGIATKRTYSQLIPAICYMFCGYIIDTAQITVWTASAAFLPFVILYYHRILFDSGHVLRNSLKLSLSLYMLMTAGYPSFLIMCGYVLLFALLAFIVTIKPGKDMLLRLLTAHSIVIIAFLLLALPALLSYIDYLPNYQRSSGTTLEEANENPFNLFGLISFFFPFSVTRDHHWLTTNPTSRSLYTGLFSILILAGIFRKKLSGKEWFIIITTLIIFLFSLGDATPVRSFFFHLAPGMNLFRHPGTMRLFVTVGLLLLLAPCLERFLYDTHQQIVSRYRLLARILLLAFALAIIANIPSSSIVTNIFNKGSSAIQNFSRDGLKALYDSLNFSDTIIIEGTIQIIFLLLFLYFLRRKIFQPSWFVMLFSLNVVLFAQFSIPFTVVTKQSPGQINQFISSSPEGYPIPDSVSSIDENTLREKTYNRTYGAASVYLKKVAWIDEVVNPSHNKNLFALSEASTIRNAIFRNPVVYVADTVIHYSDSLSSESASKQILFADNPKLSNDVSDQFEISSVQTRSFEPNRLLFRVQTSTMVQLCVFQCYNKNWKVFIDGVKHTVSRGNIAFMYTNVPAGSHEVLFEYAPSYLSYTVFISILTLAIMIMLIFFSGRKISNEFTFHGL